MKKVLLIIAISIFVIACDKKETVVKEVKTAYVDTSELMKSYAEAKDLEEKYKALSQEKGSQLEAEINRFKQDASNFQKQAQANGPEWAQKKGAELQKKEQQLSYAQQALSQELQQTSSAEMDTLVKSVKQFIKDYGKKNGYTYIYGTGEVASVLYAEEKLDITKIIIKELNAKYASKSNNETKTEIKEEVKKETKK